MTQQDQFGTKHALIMSTSVHNLWKYIWRKQVIEICHSLNTTESIPDTIMRKAFSLFSMTIFAQIVHYLYWQNEAPTVMNPFLASWDDL